VQPKIIVTKNREDRDQKIWSILKEPNILPNNPDLLLIEDEKIGIKEIKILINHLSTKPFGQTAKSAVILDGTNITPDAQNALLKTLEEPSGESIILIGVDSETKLLPTVLSRCLVISLQPSAVSSQTNFDLEKLLNASIEERFEIVEKAADKDKLLNELTESYRSKVLKGEGNVKFLEDLLQSQIWKENKVNTRTILEYLMLILEK
jgi:hypothetical protein